MPGFNPLGGPSLTQLGTLAGKRPDPQLVGNHSVALNLGNDGGAKLKSMGLPTNTSTGGGSVAMPTNTNTGGGGVLPVAPSTSGGGVTPIKPPSGNAGGAPSVSMPGASTGDVIKTASALATEDEWARYTPKDAEHVEYIKGPDGVVRPTLVISNPNIVGGPAPGGGGGAGAPPPMPPPEPTRPPLVSAGPVKKSSAWLWLGLAAAAALFT